MPVTRRDFVAAVMAAGATAGLGSGAHAAADAAEAKQDGDASVYVIATITVKAGKRDEFVRIFKGNVPAVLAEDGCVFYDPVVDTDSGIAAQAPLRPDIMVVMEKWESLDALLAHLDAPHMHTYREAVKDLVAGVDLQVLRYA